MLELSLIHIYLDELQEKAVIEREFRPGIETTERNYRYAGWKKAVKRAMAWDCLLYTSHHQAN